MASRHSPLSTAAHLFTAFFVTAILIPTSAFSQQLSFLDHPLHHITTSARSAQSRQVRDTTSSNSSTTSNSGTAADVLPSSMGYLQEAAENFNISITSFDSDNSSTNSIDNKSTGSNNNSTNTTTIVDNLLPAAPEMLAEESGYNLQLASHHKGHHHKGHDHKGRFGHHSNHLQKGHKKGSHGEHHNKGHHRAGGKKYRGGDHKHRHHHGGKYHAKGDRGQHLSAKKDKQKGHKKKGHKQLMKKDETDRKKQFYDESDHQEYHIEYDTVDEYFDHHDENDYKGGAKKALEKHDEHGEKGHHDKSKHNKHNEGGDESYGHNEHKEHKEKYDAKKAHKEAEGHASGHHGREGSNSHGKGSHSVQSPVRTPAKPVLTLIPEPHLIKSGASIESAIPSTMTSASPYTKIPASPSTKIPASPSTKILASPPTKIFASPSSKISAQATVLEVIEKHPEAPLEKQLEVSKEMTISARQPTVVANFVTRKVQFEQPTGKSKLPSIVSSRVWQSNAFKLNKNIPPHSDFSKIAVATVAPIAVPVLLSVPKQDQKASAVIEKIVPAPVLLHKTVQKPNDTEGNFGSISRPTKIPEIIFFRNGQISNVPEVSSSIVSSRSDRPTPKPMRIKNLPLISGFKQNVNIKTSVDNNLHVSNSDRSEATLDTSGIQTIKLQEEESRQSGPQTEDVEQLGSNIQKNSEVNPVLSNELSEEELLRYLVGPDAGGYGKKVSAAENQGGHAIIPQKADLEDDQSRESGSNNLERPVVEKIDSDHSKLVPAVSQEVTRSSANTYNHDNEDQNKIVVNSVDSDGEVSSNIPNPKIINQNHENDQSNENDLSSGSNFSADTPSKEQYHLEKNTLHTGDQDSPAFRQALFVKSSSSGRDSKTIDEETHEMLKEEPVYEDQKQKELPSDLERQHDHLIQSNLESLGGNMNVAKSQSEQVEEGQSDEPDQTQQYHPQHQEIQRATQHQHQQNEQQQQQQHVVDNAESVVANDPQAHTIEKLPPHPAQGITIVSKGKATEPQLVAIPLLKKERSQQVSHVVGQDLKPAQTEGHKEHDGGQDYHKTAGATAKRHKEEGHKESEGGKKAEGFKKKQHKEHDEKEYKKHKDTGGKKHVAKEHKKAYKGHHKKGKKGRKGHKKGSKTVKRKGHKDNGFEKHHHKMVFTKKQNFYDGKSEKKHFTKNDNFDALFDKHKKSYAKSGMFSGGKHSSSHGKKGGHKKSHHSNDYSSHKKHHGNKGFFDKLNKHGHHGHDKHGHHDHQHSTHDHKPKHHSHEHDSHGHGKHDSFGGHNSVFDGFHNDFDHHFGDHDRHGFGDDFHDDYSFGSSDTVEKIVESYSNPQNNK